jgi:hypothetical protein
MILYKILSLQNVVKLKRKYLYPLDFKLNVAVFNTAIKLGVSIDVVDSSNMMSYQ